MLEGRPEEGRARGVQVDIDGRMKGDPKFEGSQDLPDLSYARYAEMLGLVGINVVHRERGGPADRPSRQPPP